ncbi:MAG TPA: TetR/AcrR family transcriptional regulator [Pseudonocardia sp.]|jgi:AcrR family transcriptional regulator
MRRTQDEVRHLLLASARRRLEEDGYAGVSTRAVAADANASPSLIFSYFGNKAGLIQAAVLEPFREYMADAVARESSLPPDASMLEEGTAWVRGIVRLFIEHRKSVLALIAAGALDEGPGEGLGAAFARLMGDMEGVATSWLGGWIWDGYHVPTALRASLGMIISMTVLTDLLFEPANQPSEQQVVEQVSHMLVNGLAGPHGRPEHR